MRRLVRLVVFAVTLLIVGGFAESSVQAGFLKNGVSPRDGDRLQTRRVPPRGTKKRLYAPGERPAAAPKPQGKRRQGKQAYAWFWKSYSPRRSAASPSRWGRAIETMAARRAVGKWTVHAGTVADIRNAYGAQITTAARRHSVSEALLVAVIAVESRGQLQAKSPKGAQGLMQLIPATAKRFGVSNVYNSGQNINGGAAYLNWLLKEFKGDPLLALAGYNAGEGAVRKHLGVPPYKETRDYVVKVMDAVAAVQSHCADAPVSPRAPCRFTDRGSS